MSQLKVIFRGIYEISIKCYFITSDNEKFITAGGSYFLVKEQ